MPTHFTGSAPSSCFCRSTSSAATAHRLVYSAAPSASKPLPRGRPGTGRLGSRDGAPRALRLPARRRDRAREPGRLRRRPQRRLPRGCQGRRARTRLGAHGRSWPWRVAAPLRPCRLPARGCRLPAHASRAWYPCAPAGAHSHRDDGRVAGVRPIRVVVRVRARTRLRGGVRDDGDGIRARHGAPARVGRKTDDPLSRHGRRGETEAPARDDLPRGAARAVIRSGGRILVDQLELHGVDIAFGVPGESYLPILDALRDSRVEFVVCRHEAGAASMAEAYGKLTGRPGICLVTRGPGATHASVGVHTAAQDSTPMILLVGQVPRGLLGREAFQKVDYERMFGGLAKWVLEADRADRLPEHLARAFEVSMSGRPGPVVVALPEDVLAEESAPPDAAPV